METQSESDASKKAIIAGWGNVPRWTLGHLAFSRSAAAVYLVLATHVNREWLAWPSIGTIMDFTGLKRSTVRIALRSLVEKHLLEVARLGGGRRADGTGIATVYRLLTEDKGAATCAVKGAATCAVNGAAGQRATAQLDAKKGAASCAETYKRTSKATAGAAGAAAAGDENMADPEAFQALRAAGVGNPARDRLARTVGVSAELVQREAARLEGTDKGTGILIENIQTAAGKSIATAERRAREHNDTRSDALATAAKLESLAAANEAAKTLINTLPDDRVAELHSRVLDHVPLLKLEVWKRADPRSFPDLMREIARLARKESEVPA